MFQVVAVDGVTEAIDYVNSRPKPLALYVFSTDKYTQKKVVCNTSSGCVQQLCC